MSESRLRLYRVTDHAKTIGVGYVRARSLADAKRKAVEGEVQFDYEPDDSSVRAALVRDPEEARFFDPGPPDSREPRRDDNEHGGASRPEQADRE